jgi:hypothetical protein
MEAGDDLLGDCTCASTSGDEDIPDGYACVIRIAKPHETRVPVVGDPHMIHYAETLLHEMLHAYFDIYVCRHNKACDQESDSMVGRGGHQKSWQEAALIIERSTTRLLGYRFDMDRHNGLMSDWKSDETIIANWNEIDLLRRGINPQELYQDIQDYCDEDGEEKQEDIRVEESGDDMEVKGETVLEGGGDKSMEDIDIVYETELEDDCEDNQWVRRESNVDGGFYDR